MARIPRMTMPMPRTMSNSALSFTSLAAEVAVAVGCIYLLGDGSKSLPRTIYCDYSTATTWPRRLHCHAVSYCPRQKGRSSP